MRETGQNLVLRSGGSYAENLKPFSQRAHAIHLRDACIIEHERDNGVTMQRNATLSECVAHLNLAARNSIHTRSEHRCVAPSLTGTVIQ